MKKISILIAVVAVMMCFSVTAFASNEAPFSFAADNIDVALGEGTENVEVAFSMTFDSDVNVSTACIWIDTDGLSVVSMNGDEMAAYIPMSVGSSDAANGMLTFLDESNFSTATIPAGTAVDFVATLAVDKAVEETYTITLTGDTLVVADDWATPINDGVTYPSMTITVEEAAPAVEYEDKDFAVATVTADKSDIVIGEDTYTNVAKYVGVINLDTIKASLQTGETLKAAGIKINNVAKAVFDIAGTGEVDYSILFYGITPAQADALNVATYYTANVIKAN